MKMNKKLYCEEENCKKCLEKYKVEFLWYCPEGKIRK
jgi:hypothetical protein